MSPGARGRIGGRGLRSGGMALSLDGEPSSDCSYTAFQCTGDGQVETRLDLLDLNRRAVPQQRKQAAAMQLRAQGVPDGRDVKLQALDVLTVPVE